MVKRKAPSKDESDFEASASEQSDYTPSATKSKAKPKGITGAGRKRAKRTGSDEGLATEGEDTFDLPAHSVTRHAIGARSAPMQGALLAWFEGVHDARGMPWRKPFDALADADARSQRAYEVPLYPLHVYFI